MSTTGTFTLIVFVNVIWTSIIKYSGSYTSFVFKAHLVLDECIAVVIVGPLPRSTRNHTYIMTVTENYSCYLEAYPLNGMTSKTAINCLKKYFSLFGIPKILISDNGSCFTSNEFE